jgi:hypothetical protein
MTSYAFRYLSPVVQLYWVLKHGFFPTQHEDRGVETKLSRVVSSH